MISKTFHTIFGLVLISANSITKDESNNQGMTFLFNRKKAIEQDVDTVKVVQGFRGNPFEKMIVSPEDSVTAFNPVEYFQNLYSFPEPIWRASAFLLSSKPESSGNHRGFVNFQQWSGNYIKINVNLVGITPGKHALHIHAYGDISDGCRSTGYQLPGSFLGNIQVQPGGKISTTFLSNFITLFGFNGIIGRSIVIHEGPIDINTSLNNEVFSIPLHQSIKNIQYQTEESQSEAPIACGIISITKNVVEKVQPLSSVKADPK
ncbi:CUSOD1 family protein [Megaselia abdita]